MCERPPVTISMICNKKATCSTRRIILACCLRVTKLREVETVVLNTYFNVLPSTVRKAAFVQCRVDQLSTPLCAPKGPDEMQRDCGSLSHGRDKKASFNTLVTEQPLVLLTTYSRISFEICRFHFSEFFHAICVLESPRPSSETQSELTALTHH